MDETAREIGISFDSLLEELTTKLTSWGEELVALLPNLVIALILLVVAAVAARLMRRGVSGAVQRVTGDAQLAYLIGIATSVTGWMVGIFVVLGIMQLDKTVTSLLAGVGIVGLALGFAFQEIAADFLSGVVLSLRRPYRAGDLVELCDFCGVVDDLDLRTTKLRQLSGEVVRIPNKQVFGNPMVNLSEAPARRVDLEIGVSYGSDLEQVREVTRGAARTVGGRLPERDVEVFFTGFGDSSIDLVVRFWVPSRSQRDWLAARSEAVMAIKAAYDREGITIPFPIRTLDFGIVGGVPLSDMLSDGA